MSADVSHLISFLVGAARRMAPADRSIWSARLSEVYGDLAGQRAFEGDPEAREYLDRFGKDSAHDIIIALQTYFAFVCDILAVAHLSSGSTRSPLNVSSMNSKAMRQLVENIASARIYQSLGVSPAANPISFEWFVPHLTVKDVALFKTLIALAAPLAGVAANLPGNVDVMQWLYANIMPRNLRHVLGEFYTPPWLANLLLDDTGWDPTKRLIDPYGGSGVFIVAALASARRHGCDPLDVLGNVTAIDLNPVAYVATRANIIFATVTSGKPNRRPIRLPILCADAILPSVLPDSEPGLLTPADVLVTNPPWVGWEYMARPYRDRLNPVWKKYSLYTARGREAAFLKEDLSTLALVGAWDRYLKPGGTSAVLLRPASMKSHLAARGLRRLSIHPDAAPLCLRLIREFVGLRPFANTATTASAWLLQKGEHTVFPVPVKEWRPNRRAWQPQASDSLEEVRSHVTESHLTAIRSDPANTGSAWTIGKANCHDATASMIGANDYKVRAGVFTGGANAVYYLERLPKSSSARSHWYRNIVERAKRQVQPVEVELERDLIFEIVRGRDLSLWSGSPGSLILCPHSPETRMRALPQAELANRYPGICRYLLSMKGVLDERKGFSGWERQIQAESFYAIQRIGAYTFSPYKTAWKYIASDFVVAVIGPDKRGRPQMCNDKVMYLSFEDEMEAYFVCGLLSSDPVRWCVVSTMTGTQISTSAIKHLKLPQFSKSDRQHRLIADACKRGHAAVSSGDLDGAEKELEKINQATGKLYELTDDSLEIIHSELSGRFSHRRFS